MKLYLSKGNTLLRNIHTFVIDLEVDLYYNYIIDKRYLFQILNNNFIPTKVVGESEIHMKIKNVQEVKSLDKETQKIISSDSSKSSKIKSLFSLGIEVKEIALLLGIRYNFAYNVISNMIIVEGVEVESTKQSSKKDLVRDLFNQGKSTKEIAIDLRTNYNYIYKIVKELKEESEIKQLEKEA